MRPTVIGCGDAKCITLTHMNPTMLAHADEARGEGLMVAEDGLVVEF